MSKFLLLALSAVAMYGFMAGRVSLGELLICGFLVAVIGKIHETSKDKRAA